MKKKTKSEPDFIDNRMLARHSSSTKLKKIRQIGVENILFDDGTMVDLDNFEKNYVVVWCVTPTGIENAAAHMKFVSSSKDGKMICAFCRRDSDWIYCERD